MKEINICELEKPLNTLLEKYGFNERFSAVKADYTYLTLKHLTDKKKQIDLVDEYGELTLFYLDTHSHIYDENGTDIESVFTIVKNVLSNRELVYHEKDKKENVVMSASIDLDAKYARHKIKDKLKSKLKEARHVFLLWDKTPTDEEKLYTLSQI